MTPSLSAPLSQPRRLLRGWAWVAAGALALGLALELWQSAMNQRFAAEVERWLQGSPGADDGMELPDDASERALLRSIRKDPRAKRVVKVDTWSRGGWLTLCVADAKAYVVSFAVHVQGGHVVDLANIDPAVCRRPAVQPPSGSSGAK